ncbi:hypothetical protein VMCG_04733 [Cytospora schulzeri]|uniref:Carboxylic ester hydrolase n=1 Tax=Cytospora schulzeri TaxID=448051 RepID=A0A423WMU6_9PEZI|nr:hypothetical protein VMCG_04733 [Valsa malicola]
MLTRLYLLLSASASCALGYPRYTALEDETSSPTVDLGYAKYRGTRLSGGVDQYLGMRYASPPLGDLRFRAPQDPRPESGIQNASNVTVDGTSHPVFTDTPAALQFGPICVGVGQDASDTRTEDCLYVNVFTPSGATPSSKLPVWVYIQGGGYATNSNANYNGTDVIENAGSQHNGTHLVRNSGYNLVFVNFNYRVGALGFLASEKVKEDGALNAGLLDQRKLLHWVQTNIAKFGGDPDHVVIHGASAGAGSVAHHLTAYDGVDRGLFVGAVSESTFWPTQRTVTEMEFQFDRFVNDTGCSDADDALGCLRLVDLYTIQEANMELPFPGASDNSPAPLWYWLPVTTGPGTLVPDRLYNSFSSGRFIRVPLLVGDDTNEGTDFAANASTQTEVSQFLESNYPGLYKTQLSQINSVYPLTKAVPEHAAYFPSAAAAYGDAAFTCPGNIMADSMASFYDAENVWNYRYNVLDPSMLAAGVGVPHTFETAAIFGPGYAGSVSESYYTTNEAIVPVVMNYWISFVRALDPNTYKYGEAPVWQTWGDTGRGNRLNFQTYDTVMEKVPQQLVERCKLWKRLSNSMET